MSWRAYFPDDGQGPSDAVDLQHSAYRPRTIYDAEDAARVACEMDYNRRDGWERGEYEFAIAIIAPDGTETRWQGMHERTIAHTVREDDKVEIAP